MAASAIVPVDKINPRKRTRSLDDVGGADAFTTAPSASRKASRTSRTYRANSVLPTAVSLQPLGPPPHALPPTLPQSPSSSPKTTASPPRYRQGRPDFSNVIAAREKLDMEFPSPRAETPDPIFFDQLPYCPPSPCLGNYDSEFGAKVQARFNKIQMERRRRYGLIMPAAFPPGRTPVEVRHALEIAEEELTRQYAESGSESDDEAGDGVVNDEAAVQEVADSEAGYVALSKTAPVHPAPVRDLG